MKHSPGPWKYSGILKVGDTIFANLASEENPHERMCLVNTGDIYISEKEADANCHLIRYAPDMLEVLEAIAEHSSDDTVWCWESWSVLQDRVLYLIKKAKGE
jgi:hypothetical protein